ncbi:MAG TPA: hypothetical protein PKL17_07050 [Pseudomonadota bacterium]|nr:hypothetical protein [Pseudomonadota bacterium]HNK44521.1 hypothetical protein [Pseudomonadota bacterium]
MSRERFLENPFYVLGVRPECSRAEMEREGQKLLGMLEIGLPSAKKYKTPLGEAERTPEMVRQAMAELRDPQRRLLHELWAQLPAERVAITPNGSDGGSGPGPWPDAVSALGFGAKK